MFHRQLANIKTIFSPRTPNLHHISIIACHDERSHPKSHHLPPFWLLFWPTLLTTREMLLPASLWCFIYFVLMLCAYVFFSLLEALTAAEETWTPKILSNMFCLCILKIFRFFTQNKIENIELEFFRLLFFYAVYYSPLIRCFTLVIKTTFYFLSAFNPIEHKKANKHKKKARRK